MTSIVDSNYSICSLKIDSGSGALVLSSPGGYTLTIASSFTDSSSNPVTASVAIAGTGGLTNNGGGTLTLSGSNTYSGVTSVSASSKIVDGAPNSLSPNSAVSLTTGGNLTTNYTEVINGLSGDNSATVSIGGPKFVTNGSNGGSGYVYAGTIVGSGVFEVGSGGYQILTGNNTYGGGTTIDCMATLQLGDGETTGSITGNVANNGTLAFNNPGCYTFPGQISGNGGVNVEGGMLTLSGANTYYGATVVASARLSDGSNNAFSPNSAFYLSNEARLTVSNSEAINGLSGDNSTTVCINGANLATSGSNGGSGYVYAGTIMGSGSFEVGSGGYQILTGNNTYGGGTTIDCMATLQLGNGETTGSITGNVADSGTLAFNNPGSSAFSGMISGSGGVAINGGTVTFTVSGNNYSGTTSVASAKLVDGTTYAFSPNSAISLTSNAALGVYNNEVINGLGGDCTTTVCINGANLVTTGNNGPCGYVYAGTIMGCGSLEVGECGYQVLTGTNTYSGGTYIDGGATLQLGNRHATGSIVGNVTNNGTLVFDNGESTSISNAISGSGGVTIEHRRVTFLTSEAYTGGTTIDRRASLQLGDGDDWGSITGSVTDNGRLIFDDPGCFTFCGQISGNGGVRIEDGMVTLMGMGNNTYSGTTRVDSATLIDGTCGAFSQYSAIVLTNEAKLSVNYNETINGLGGDSSATVCINGTNLVTQGSTDRHGNPYAFAGTIMGTGSLEVSSFGESNGYQILTGSNTYSGGTAIDCMATLQLGDGENTGSIVGNVADNGTLVFDNPNCFTFTGQITGKGNVTVQGGMVTLTASSTYCGGTTINSYATLQLGDGENTGSIRGDVADDGTLVFDNPNCFTFCGNISGGGGVTVKGGMVTLMGTDNSYSGTTSVESARLVDGASYAFSPNSAISLTSNATLGVYNNEVINGLGGDCTTTVCINGANLVTTGNNGPCGYVYAGTIMGCGSLEVGECGYQVLTGTNTYSGGTTIDCMATLQLGNRHTTGSIAGDVTNYGTLVFDNGQSTSFSGLISGSGDVTIEHRTVTFLTSETYTGGTTIDRRASLQLGDGDDWGSITGSVTDNGRLIFDDPGCFTFCGQISGYGGVRIEDGMVTLMGMGNNTYSGTTRVDSAKLSDGTCGAFSQYSAIRLTDEAQLSVNYNETINGLSGDSSSTVCINGANLVTQGSADRRGNPYAFAGTIMGTGSLEVASFEDSNGYQILTGSNTYSGGTMIDCMATLQLGDGENTGSIVGNVTDNGTLIFENPGCSTFPGQITGNGSVSVQSGMVTLTSENTYTGGTNISYNTVLQLGDGESTGSIVGTVSDYGTLVFDNPGCFTFCGSIYGIGGVTIKGGMVTFMAAEPNSYFGPTLVESAKLSDGTSGSFSPFSVMSLVNGARLNVNFSEAIGGLSGDSTAAVNLNNGAILTTSGYDDDSGYTFAGTIAGTGGLEVAYSAYQILTGADTYSGGTTIDSMATLQLGDGESTGSIVGNVTDNGTLAFDDPTSITFPGQISGSGNVEVDGGMVTLSGNNSYSGGTVVESGTLGVSTSDTALGTGNVTVGYGGTLQIRDARTLANTMDLFGPGAGGAGALDSAPGESNTATVSGAITLTGSTSTSTTISSDSGTLVLSGGITGSGGNLTLSGAGNTTVSSAVALGAGSVTINGTGTTTLSVANSYSGGTSVSNGTVNVDNDGALGSGPLSAYLSVLNFNSASPSLASGASFNLSTANFAGASLTLTGPTLTDSTLNFNATGAAPLIENMVSDSTDSLNVLNLVSGSASLTFQETEASFTDYHGEITGLGSVVKTDMGTLELEGANSYSGGTDIKAGNLAVSTSNTALGSGPVTVENMATLDVDSGLTLSNPIQVVGTGAGNSGALISNPGSASTATLSGAVTLGGNTTFDSVSGTFVLAGGVSGSGDNLTLLGPGNTTLNSALALGSGSLTIDGTGTTILSAANSYSGGTIVQAGVLAVSTSNTALGSGSVTIQSGAALEINDGRALSNPLSLAGAGTGGAGALISNPGASATASLFGAVTLAGDTKISSNSGTLSLGGGISGPNDNLIFSGAGNTSVGNSISLGSGSVTVAGPGGTALWASNAYSGGTNLEGGTLYVGGSASLGSGALSANAASSTPELAPIGGNVTLSNNIVLNANGLVLNYPGSPNTLTLTGTISDFGSFDPLVVNGPVVLSGTNTYSGGTTLNGGTLYVTNSSSLGTGRLTVADPVTMPVLAPMGANVTLSNPISIPSTGLALNVSGGTSTLTLNGAISDNGPSGALVINGPVTLNGSNTYSGGTTINNVTTGTGVTVGSNSPFGTGPVTATGSLINFSSSSPSVTDAFFTAATQAIFSGSPVLTNPSLSGATLEFNGSAARLNDMASDSSGSGNSIDLGTGTVLTFHESGGNETDYYGTIAGSTGSVVMTGPGGTLDLTGANTYGGGTTISGGVLIASSSAALGSGPVTVNGSSSALGLDTGVVLTNQIVLTTGEVAGYGTFSPSLANASVFDIQNGNIVAAGRGTYTGDGGSNPVQGKLTFDTNTTLTFGPGGVYQFAIENSGPGTVAGTDYSTINANGAFSITATPANPFTIDLLSVNSSGSLGTATFSGTQPNSWTLLTASSPIGSFSSNDFAFNTTQFNSGVYVGWHWSVTEGPGDMSLVLNFTPVPEPSTWLLMASGLLTLGAAYRRRRR